MDNDIPDTISVITSSAGATRSSGAAKELKVELVAENVRVFLSQVETILQESPQTVSGFQLDEVTVSAEISGTGKLTLVGTGVETTAKGGLTFTFKRKEKEG